MVFSRLSVASLGAGFVVLCGCFSPDPPTGATATDGTGSGSTSDPGTTQTTPGTSPTETSTTGPSTTDPTGTSNPSGETDPTDSTGEPDTTPPTVEDFDVSPTVVDEARFVQLSATVTDDVAVDRVEFLQGEEVIGTATEEPYEIAWKIKTQDQDGDYQVRCVAFDTSENSTDSMSLAVGVDLPARGTLVWDEVVDGSTGFFEYGRAIVPTETGGALVAGGKEIRDFALSVNTPDIWLREYSGGGTESWTTTNNATSYAHDGSEAIAVDPMGFIIVAGWTRPGDAQGSPIGTRNVRVIKYAPGGQSIDWDREYGENDEGWAAYGVGTDDAGRVYVGGVANNNVWVARLAEDDGAIEFEDTFNSVDGASRVNGLAADGDGNFVVAGEAAGDVWIRRYNADESVDWTETVDGPDQAADRGLGVAIGPDGDVGVIGQFSGLPFDQSIWFARYDVDGNLQWSQTRNPGADEGEGRAIAFDAEGEVVVTGMVEEVHNGIDIWIARYSADGESVLWETTYNGSSVANGSDDYGYGIAVDEVGYVYVTGSTHQYNMPVEPGWDADWNSAIWTRKYTP